MKTTRVFQLTALVLVVISVLTVGWWAIDLRGFITERTQDALKLHEQEVVAAQALLDAGRSPAEARVLQEQDHFLAMVSHQFKTPLASLQLSLETMSMRSLSPADQRSLIDR